VSVSALWLAAVPRRPCVSPPSPCTTLFRSLLGGVGDPGDDLTGRRVVHVEHTATGGVPPLPTDEQLGRDRLEDAVRGLGCRHWRSEEHTSELRHVKISYGVCVLRDKSKVCC